jgi:luciferase family oxidoreductase group 1
VLDQTPIRKGSKANESLQESIELAKLADQLGYHRYWLSEHHNTITLAMAAPEIFMARLAGETSRIRFGSGGIMLPNHSTLKVAENFRLLEALYPNRIDLGIGRAPGGDRVSSYLLNPSNTFDPKDYVGQIVDLKGYLTDTAEPGSAQEKVRAIPKIDTVPALWMLTSSGESAYLAAHFGIGVSFAHFINPVGGPEAIAAYKERFKPSDQLAQPVTSVGIFAFCGENEEKVNQWQALMDHRLLSFEKGKFDKFYTYDDIKSIEYSQQDQARINFNRSRCVSGTPGTIKAKITALASEYDTNEIILATMTDNAADRFQSYKLFAEAFELQG